MPSPNWERLFETCFRNDGIDLLLVPGSPPLIRLKDGWGTLNVTPLTADEIRDMVQKRFDGQPFAQGDGFAYLDLRHGDEEMFRASAFGYPETKVLLISRSSPSSSEPTGV